MAGEEVHLRVGASPVAFRLVRLVTAGVANARGFALDGIEDLRIAVHEACAALSDGDPPVTLDLRFRMTDTGLEVAGSIDSNGTGEDPVPPGPGLMTPLSQRLLEVVVTSFEVDSSGFRLTKDLPITRPAP